MNVLFDKTLTSETPWAKKLWTYDLRTNKHFTLKTDPLKGENLDEFVTYYNSTNRHTQVVAEIGLQNVMNLFAGKKALPAFLAFCQTRTGKVTALGPIPISITMLLVGKFGDVQAHQRVFDKINLALHDCSQ